MNREKVHEFYSRCKDEFVCICCKKIDVYHTSKWDVVSDDMLNQFKELVVHYEKIKQNFLLWAVYIGSMLRGLQDNQEDEYQARKKTCMKIRQDKTLMPRDVNDDFG